MPRQMTAETLNALKGWPQLSAVDFHTEFAASITDRVPAGSVVHLNNTGKYELGVGQDAVMPLFTFHASDDPDISNDGGDPATERGVFVPIGGSGQAMALVAIGAYELVTTEFVDGTYYPNTPLTSAKTGPTAGQLVEGTLYEDMVVGLVSRGIVDNGWGHEGLAFWPCVVFPIPAAV